MKAFKFRLQTVLDIAQKVQDQKAQILAAAEAVRQAAVERLEAAEREQQAKRDELLAFQKGTFDLQTIQWGLEYLGKLSLEEASARQEIAEAAEKVDEARRDLMAAAQKVQALEKLKAKAKADYQAIAERSEASF